MRPMPSQKISNDALKIWRLTGFLSTLFYALLVTGYYYFMNLFELPFWPFFLGIFLIILIFTWKVVLLPKLRWKKWRFEIYDNELDLHYGVFVIRRVLIPMIRVQHVDTTQGPIMRRYKLATVTITTAATVHEIPALSEENAASLRDYISQLAMKADEDV